jgi:thiopeptide-type bacteriocin biosynthesis protein
LFHADSTAAIEIIDNYHSDSGHDLRWRLALLGLDQLSRDFALPLSARIELISRLRDGLAIDFNIDSRQRQALGGRLRRERTSLSALLTSRPAKCDPLYRGEEALRRRSEQLRPVVARLLAEHDADSIRRLLPSYLHMFINRLMPRRTLPDGRRDRS